MVASFKERKRVRVPVDVEAYYRYSSQWYPCVLRDLNSAGAGLKINQTLVPGDALRIRFGALEADRVVRASVAHVNGNRVGVRFESPGEIRELILSSGIRTR